VLAVVPSTGRQDLGASGSFFVLRGKDLDRSPDLVFAPDYRVELPLGREPRQVAAYYSSAS